MKQIETNISLMQGRLRTVFNRFEPSLKKKQLHQVSSGGETHLLCISTITWVFRTLFAGQNQFFDAETTFLSLTGQKKNFFFFFFTFYDVNGQKRLF